MSYDDAADMHGAWWYRCWDGTSWSKGPGERYDWWTPGPSERELDAPWVLQPQQQLEMRHANTRRRVTFEDAPRVTFEDTAVAETSGHPRRQATRVQNRPLPRIRTRGGSADRPPSPPLPPIPSGGAPIPLIPIIPPIPISIPPIPISIPPIFIITPYTPYTEFDSAEDDRGDSAEAAEHVRAGA